MFRTKDFFQVRVMFVLLAIFLASVIYFHRCELKAIVESKAVIAPQSTPIIESAAAACPVCPKAAPINVCPVCKSTPECAKCKGSFTIPVETMPKCKSKVKTRVKRSDLNESAIIFYPELEKPELQKLVAQRHHGNFMPAMSRRLKKDYLYLCLIVIDALKARNVEFFLKSGALLGIHRHGALVPWDQDIDMTVFVGHWREMHEALSCIEGYSLTWSKKMGNLHVRFTYEGRYFPYVDFFIYGVDNYHVYALHDTKYMKYYWRDVFPVKDVVIEGITVPAPHNITNIVNNYGSHLCKLGGITFAVDKTWAKGYKDAFTKTVVNCSDIAYMYKMKNINT